jgi:plastocyanin
MRRSVALAALTIATAGLAACSSGSSAGPTTVAPKADVVITAVEGIRWDAATYSATSTGGQVVVQGRNDSTLGHNLYLVGADGTQVPEHIDLGKKGDVKTETFDAPPGTYSVICKIPGHSAMKSTLTVS